MDDMTLARRLATLEDSLLGHDVPLPALNEGLPHIRLVAAILAAVAITVPVLYLRDQVAAPQQPHGLFVGRQVVGGSAVGQIVCVAVELTDEAYQTGSATAFWWTTGTRDCSNRVSGITTQAAVVADASQERGHPGAVQISFMVSTTDSQEVTLSFTMDPGQSGATDGSVPAWRTTDTQAPSLTFERVSELAIPGPDSLGPIPTPESE